MAVTKIWPIRKSIEAPLKYIENCEKTENPKWSADEQMLEDVIEYAANEKKTEQRLFVTSINCSTTCARDQFLITKKRFAKEGGIVAFHAYQSFREGETTPEEAHAIGVELAEKMWGDRFQVVVATHLNTNCLHNHFVINSVSFKDGKRYHDSRSTYALLRKTSDEICREHGLSVIRQPEGRGIPQHYYKLEQAGMPTRYNIARQAIDESIALSLNIEEFRAEMTRRGYRCRFDPKHKYWSIVPPGWKNGIRTYRLGEDYSKERIMERLMENGPEVRAVRIRQSTRRSFQYSLKRRIDRIMGRTGLEKLYLRYCYELGYLPKYTQKPTMVHAALKDDLLRCDRYSDEAKLLCRHDIRTDVDLARYMEGLDKKELRLTSERDELRKKIKRRIPEDQKEALRVKVKEFTGELRKIRKERKLCEDIRDRSEQIERKLDQVDREKKEREVKTR